MGANPRNRRTFTYTESAPFDSAQGKPAEFVAKGALLALFIPGEWAIDHGDPNPHSDYQIFRNAGRLLFNMLGAIAEFETEIRSERQLDGIHKAKELGVRFGRKQLLSASQIVELHLRRAQGTLIKILMKDFTLSKASVYRYLKKSASSEL